MKKQISNHGNEFYDESLPKIVDVYSCCKESRLIDTAVCMDKSCSDYTSANLYEKSCDAGCKLTNNLSSINYEISKDCSQLKWPISRKPMKTQENVYPLCYDKNIDYLPNRNFPRSKYSAKCPVNDIRIAMKRVKDIRKKKNSLKPKAIHRVDSKSMKGNDEHTLNNSTDPKIVVNKPKDKNIPRATEKFLLTHEEVYNLHNKQRKLKSKKTHKEKLDMKKLKFNEKLKQKRGAVENTKKNEAIEIINSPSNQTNLTVIKERSVFETSHEFSAKKFLQPISKEKATNLFNRKDFSGRADNRTPTNLVNAPLMNSFGKKKIARSASCETSMKHFTRKEINRSTSSDTSTNLLPWKINPASFCSSSVEKSTNLSKNIQNCVASNDISLNRFPMYAPINSSKCQKTFKRAHSLSHETINLKKNETNYLSFNGVLSCKETLTNNVPANENKTNISFETSNSCVTEKNNSLAIISEKTSAIIDGKTLDIVEEVRPSTDPQPDSNFHMKQQDESPNGEVRYSTRCYFSSVVDFYKDVL